MKYGIALVAVIMLQAYELTSDQNTVSNTHMPLLPSSGL